MTENEIIITLDNDDEISNGKDIDQAKSPNSSKNKRTRLTFPFGACRVCSDSATGIHYGIATCEGCKGFFKRSILRKEKYRCYFDNTCLVNVTNRNRCKACRFRRCLDEGMSVDGVKMGRIPKLVKERALKELKEQQMKEEAGLMETNDGHPRTSSCSSTSDRSIENYDPNIMETDSIKPQSSPVQRTSDLINTYTNDNIKKSSTNLEQLKEKDNITITYRTKYPTFLPDDFNNDEIDGFIEQTIGILNDDAFKNVQTIGKKVMIHQKDFLMQLNDEETRFIRYLRWSAYNVFSRRSKRTKIFVSRMNKMIENNIREYPGDNASNAEFFHAIRLSCEIYTPTTVVYIQDLPGFKNLSIITLQKMIGHRSFDWYVLKYHELFHDNGECYFVAPNGFQFTRHWKELLHGTELTNKMFHFAKSIRELYLSESEFSLVLAVHMCYDDSTMEDAETVRLLRFCYLYALYTELCHNRGDNEGRTMFYRIFKVLELLGPINELYQRGAASRSLEV